MTLTSTKAAKQVHIIARYEIKCNGYVCYRVRSSNGHDQYCTTLNAEGKATACTCPAYKPCYHMRDLERIEAERKTERANKARHQAQAKRLRKEQAAELALVELHASEEATRRAAYVAMFNPCGL